MEPKLIYHHVRAGLKVPDILTRLDRQRLASLPEGSTVRIQPCFSHFHRAVGIRPDQTRVTIQNCVAAPKAWRAAAEKDYPKLTYVGGK